MLPDCILAKSPCVLIASSSQQLNASIWYARSELSIGLHRMDGGVVSLGGRLGTASSLERLRRGAVMPTLDLTRCARCVYPAACPAASALPESTRLSQGLVPQRVCTQVGSMPRDGRESGREASGARRSSCASGGSAPHSEQRRGARRARDSRAASNAASWLGAIWSSG